MQENIKKLLIQQVNKELASAYLYLDMSKFYKTKSIEGFAHWFKKQASEELEHAEKFMDYLADNDIEYKFEPIEVFAKDYKNLKDPLIHQLEHEKYVTSLINEIYRLALEENNYPLVRFLNWFIDEQVEEEKTAKELLEQFEYVENCKMGLLKLDEQLKAR